MSAPRSVLVVEDDEDAREALLALIGARGHRVSGAGSVEEGWQKLQAADAPEVVLLDLGLPDGDGMDLLRRSGGLPGRRAVVVLTGERRLERAVEAMQLGALDYLSKPLDPEALALGLARIEQRLEEEDTSRTLRAELARRGSFEGLVGASPPMLEVYGLVEKAAPSRVPIFIQGESGTGKELLARAVHQVSQRRSAPFVAVNCGALPAGLVESELFGHERGAFTGATSRHLGVFEQAHRGTLFLDELPEMPLESQVKLLRVLETGNLRRVGGTVDIEVDVRLISATNRNPVEAVSAGLLREDLYFRLHVFPLVLPPLRERRGDVPMLAAHLLERVAQEEGGVTGGLSPGAVEALQAHDWPGNVRELRNVMSRAWLMAGGGAVLAEHLPLMAGVPAVAEGLQEEACGLWVALGSSLAQAEQALIKATLRHTNGHRGKAARVLGVSPKTLYTKCRALGLAPGKPGRKA